MYSNSSFGTHSSSGLKNASVQADVCKRIWHLYFVRYSLHYGFYPIKNQHRFACGQQTAEIEIPDFVVISTESNQRNVFFVCLFVCFCFVCLFVFSLAAVDSSTCYKHTKPRPGYLSRPLENLNTELSPAY